MTSLVQNVSDPLTAGIVAVALGVALAPLGGVLVQRFEPPRLVFFARWGFSQLLLAGVVGLVVHLIVGALTPESGPLAMVRGDAYLLGATAIAVVAGVRTQPEGWRALGLSRSVPARAIPIGLVVLLAGLPVLIGASLAWQELLITLGVSPAEVGAGARWAALEPGEHALAAVWLVAIAPVLREAFFRGFAQPLLIQNFSERGGLLLSALLFALVHPVEQFLPAFGLGLGAAIAQLRCGSLLAPIAFHAGLQAVGLWLAGSGLFEPSRLPLF